MVSHRKSMYQTTGKLRAGKRAFTSAVVALALLAAAMTAAPAAKAEPGDPFTPELSVCTDVKPCDRVVTGVDPGSGFIFSTLAPTTRAGAHPDLAIRMKRTPIHCPDWKDGTPPYHPPSGRCGLDEIYMEQSLKRMAVHLPPGLLGDVNATPSYCDPYQMWIDIPESERERYRWFCKNPDSFVGYAYLAVNMCGLNEPPDNPGAFYNCLTQPWLFGGWDPGIYMKFIAVVYNDRPREGEQGHLVVLLSDTAPYPAGVSPDPIRYPKAWVKVDISVTVRADLGMDAVAELPDPIENITRGGDCDVYPDGICVEGAYAQIADMILSLNGSTGADRGHPLLRNPTFCDPQSVEAELRGYAYNSLLFQDVSMGGVLTAAIWTRAHGDGKTVRRSVPYQVTGCEKIPYNPKLELSFSDTGPAAVPAISSTVTQDPDDATIDNVKVTFPKSFKINADNTREHCSEANLKASEEDPAGKDHCPEASKIGTVTAESPLIPIGQKLEGNVYLAGLTGDSVKFAAFLRGFVDLRIDAEGKVEDDLSITTTFKDLPPAPVSRFNLLLDGGKDKGLLKLPRVCGPEMITADFTSHSKKIKRNTVPLEVKGCKDPTLDVELSNRRKGKPTDLDLTVSSRGTAIKSVEFRLARRLHWGQRKRLSSRVASGSGAAKRTKKIRRLRSAGLITFQTASGERKVRLKAKKTKWGNLGLVPLRRKTREGKIAAAQVPGFKASLFRTARRQPALIRKKKAKGDHGRKGKGSRGRTKRRRVRRQSELTLTGLPGEDLTAVELSLKGKDRRRKFFLKNPIGCERPLNFVAIVTTKDGRKLALKDRVYLRGAGCKKRKRHKGVRQR